MSLQLKGALAAGFDAFRPQFPFENVQESFAWEQPLLIPLVVFAVYGHSVGFSFRPTLRSPLGCFLHLARELLDALTHDLARFEFHSRPRRNHEAAARLVWVASDARFGQSRLKDTEIAQFHGHVACQAVGNMIERPLNHIENLMLHHTGLIANRHNEIAFCELTHGIKGIVCQPSADRIICANFSTTFL
jgi:hypothetical protein